MEAVVKVHDTVALPEPVTPVGLTVHEVLLVVRVTTPLNPWSPATVIVEVPALPTLTVTVVGLTVNVKSWTVNVTVAE